MTANLSVAIVGAGLTGCCAALELARLGHRVLLLEQDKVVMNRASLRNEGKVHLGLIYANDPTLATARLQLRAALRFYQLLERWLGTRVQRIGVSTPFYYLVARDSLLTPGQLEHFYHAVHVHYHAEVSANPSLHYLGVQPEALAARVAPDAIPGVFNAGLLQGAFRTEERAIDTDDLAVEIRAAVAASPLIHVLAGHQVARIERGPAKSGFVLSGFAHNEGAGEARRAFRVHVLQVVNASWERRLGLDQSLGILTRPGVLHRLKYRVICRTPAALAGGPSVTMVIGRYGDMVLRPNGTMYLSWYPAGLQGWATGVEPPRDWDDSCRGCPPVEIAERVARATIAELARWVPAIEGATVLQVDAGAIVADGRTDVDDAGSGLHARVTAGVQSYDGYHSVDPGKLTAAPMFALEVAERVHRLLGG